MKKVFNLFALAVLMVSCNGDDDSGSSNCGVKKLAENETAGYDNPCAIAVSKTGRVAITRFNGFASGQYVYGTLGKVFIFNSLQDYYTGNALGVFDVYAPEAVAFDEDDNIYVSETEQVAGIAIYKKNGEGYVYHKTIQDDFNNPRGLAFDEQNRLYLADDGTGRIIRFDDPLNSNNHVTIGNWDVGIKGLAIRGSTMYVTNYNSGVVSRNQLNADGSFNILDAAADIVKATDVSVRGNVVVVTSYDNGTINVLSDCDFNEENMTTYDDLGQCFGAGFISNGEMIGAFLSADQVRAYDVNN